MKIITQNKMSKLLLAFGVVVVLQLIQLSTNRYMVGQSINLTRAASNKEFAAAKIALDMKVDVVQVQQWLTDISATRAAEGLDDGFSEADKYARLFRSNLANLIVLHPEKRDQLEQMGMAFERYYQAGKNMAEAYIQGGPSAGNQAMRGFDRTAKEIATLSDNIVKEMDQRAQASIQSAENSSASSRKAGTLLTLLIIAITILVCIVISRSIAGPLQKMACVAQKIAEGDIDQQVDHKSGDDIGILADSFRKLIDYIKGIAYAADAVARGDLSTEITVRSSGDTLSRNFIRVQSTLRELSGETAVLSKAAIEGRLDVRGDADRFQGGYRDIINGVNDTLDAVITPLNMSADYMNRISRGDIPEKITDEYKGDFNSIKESLNLVIDNLNSFISEMNKLHVNQKAGDYEYYIPNEGFTGIYRQMVEGSNEAVRLHVNNIIMILGILSAYAEGDFSHTLEELPGKQKIANQMMDKLRENLLGMIREIDKVSSAAVQGDLEVRSDESSYHGDFGRILSGINATLDTVLNPINEATSILERVAGRDLTARMTGEYKGDYNRIKQAINTAVENLDQGLAQVTSGAAQVSSASSQISSGAESLAQRASEQASSLEEVASSLAEMLSMTRQNTSNAKEAKSMADETMTSAGRGVDSMRRLSEAIERIKASSDETAKIVKTIDEIAFQTNLLALNAAVEAARAGDAGKGFAVVAEEVRSLAMRSAEAAKNTSAMIEGAVRNAEDGVSLNQEVLQNLEEINDAARRVSEVMTKIAVASEQQSQGIDQINAEVTQIDQLTQQNAANSEESASAAEELSAQAEEMKGLVTSFSLSGVETDRSSYGLAA